MSYSLVPRLMTSDFGQPPQMTMTTPTSTSSDRRAWTSTEDQAILDAVASEGNKSWSKIAEVVSTLSNSGNIRTSKQCRERFHNHLDPSISKKSWTKEEEVLIIEMQAKVGNKWAEIAKYLPGRTDNNVKNRWYSTLRRRKRGGSNSETFGDSLSENDLTVPNTPILMSDSAPPSNMGTPKQGFGLLSPTFMGSSTASSPLTRTTNTLAQLTPINVHDNSKNYESLVNLVNNFPEVRQCVKHSIGDLSLIPPLTLATILTEARTIAENVLNARMAAHPLHEVGSINKDSISETSNWVKPSTINTIIIPPISTDLPPPPPSVPQEARKDKVKSDMLPPPPILSDKLSGLRINLGAANSVNYQPLPSGSLSSLFTPSISDAFKNPPPVTTGLISAKIPSSPLGPRSAKIPSSPFGSLGLKVGITPRNNWDFNGNLSDIFTPRELEKSLSPSAGGFAFTPRFNEMLGLGEGGGNLTPTVSFNKFIIKHSCMFQQTSSESSFLIYRDLTSSQKA
jgi:hypothetical protein